MFIMIIISKFFLTTLLTLGVLSSTAVNAEFVAKPLILGVLTEQQIVLFKKFLIIGSSNPSANCSSCLILLLTLPPLGFLSKNL